MYIIEKMLNDGLTYFRKYSDANMVRFNPANIRLDEDVFRLRLQDVFKTS